MWRLYGTCIQKSVKGLDDHVYCELHVLLFYSVFVNPSYSADQYDIPEATTFTIATTTTTQQEETKSEKTQKSSPPNDSEITPADNHTDKDINPSVAQPLESSPSPPAADKKKGFMHMVRLYLYFVSVYNQSYSPYLRL